MCVFFFVCFKLQPAGSVPRLLLGTAESEQYDSLSEDGLSVDFLLLTFIYEKENRYITFSSPHSVISFSPLHILSSVGHREISLLPRS